MTALRALPLVLIVFVVFFLLHAVVEDRKLQIAVESGRISFEPAFVRLRIRVEPHPENRALAVGIVSDSFETSSFEQLDGGSARTRWREFRDVPAGEYAAFAHLVRSDGSEAVAQDTITVIGRGF